MLLAAVTGLTWSAHVEGATPVAVLIGSGVPAYESALEGIQAGFSSGRAGMAPVFRLSAGDDAKTLQRLRAANPGVVVSIGVRAATVSARLGVPYLATMLLDDEASRITPAGLRLASITLDVTPRTAFTLLLRAFPPWRRIAVIRGPAQVYPSLEDINAQASALGFSVLIIDCNGPKDLLANLPRLRGRVDAIWCLPNRDLYDPLAVQALILSSIRFRLPVIGFSEAFIRAGALLGFVADYRDVGLQSAELLRRHHNGETISLRQTARSIRSLVNERVARALGIDLSRIPQEVERIR